MDLRKHQEIMLFHCFFSKITVTQIFLYFTCLFSLLLLLYFPFLQLMDKYFACNNYDCYTAECIYSAEPHITEQ